MLTKQHRFSFHSGTPKNSSHSHFFVLRYQREEHLQVAIVVSKRVAPHAVDRNKVKRAYKRVIAKILTEYPISYSLVFYARKQSVAAKDEVLQHAIEQIFRKEGIIQ